MRPSPVSAIMVIPVHNERATIASLVTAVRQYGPVIVADDASTDGSGRLAVLAGATVITLPRHAGKGKALQHGFAEALQRGAQVVITLDGDGQHDPQDIPRLLLAGRRWPQSLIIGDRLAAPEAVPQHRLQAIQVASFWLNWLGQCQVRDTQSGFRLYPAPLLRQLQLRHGGFLLESEAFLKARQGGYIIHSVPIRTIYPSGHTSHYRPCKDGTIAALYLLYRGLCFWPAQLWQLWPYRQPQGSTLPAASWHTTLVALRATLLLPLLFLAMCIQFVLRPLGYDILTPMIGAFYHQHLRRQPSIHKERTHAKHCYHQSATL